METYTISASCLSASNSKAVDEGTQGRSTNYLLAIAPTALWVRQARVINAYESQRLYNINLKALLTRMKHLTSISSVYVYRTTS